MAVLETEKNKLLTRRIKMYKLKYGLNWLLPACGVGKKMSPNRFLVYQALDIETNLKERMII